MQARSKMYERESKLKKKYKATIKDKQKRSAGSYSPIFSAGLALYRAPFRPIGLLRTCMHSLFLRRLNPMSRTLSRRRASRGQRPLGQKHLRDRLRV